MAKKKTAPTATRVDAIVRQPVRVWFTMVRKADGKWHRVGSRYLRRETAVSWLSFVRGAWRGCKVKISQCTIRFTADGKLHPKSVEILDKKFNAEVGSV